MKNKPQQAIAKARDRERALRMLDEAASLVARRAELLPDWKERIAQRVLFGKKVPRP